MAEGKHSSVPPPTEDLSMEPARTEAESMDVDMTAEEPERGHSGETAGQTAGQTDAAEVTKENGDTEHPGNTSSDKPADTPAGTEDTETQEMEKSADAGGSGSSPAAAAAANGTPASSKKASNGSSKKRSSIIPEHKSKKLNKKKSKPMTHLDAKPGEYYLGRMRGHPPWPSIICDEEMLPSVLLSNRPVTTKQPDGTYKKPEYADGGKRAYERTFPIMFLYTNEFAWITNTELTPLDPETCKEISEKAKSKNLMAAYELAAENHDLAYFKEMLVDHQRFIEEEEEAKAEREAKKASKAKRKSVDTSATADNENGGVDEMDVDEDAGETKPKSKKRKKEADSDGDTEKPMKTPKTASKLKLSTPKTPAAEPASKKKASKPKASSKKSAAKAGGSDEEMVDTPKVEEKPLTPQEAMQKKEKEVLYIRHKLQRGFLSRDTMPKEEEMKSMSDFLSKLESYPDLEGSIIRATKIHKVLKAMIKLSSIPRDEDYNFKKRSHELLSKWNKILQDDPNAAAGADKDDDGKDDAPATTNGVSKAESPIAGTAKTEDQAKAAEAGEAIAPEEKKQEDVEKELGTTVEGDKEADEAAAAQQKHNDTAEMQTEDLDAAPEKAYEPPAETVEATA